MQKKSADAMIHRERTSFLKGLLHLLTSKTAKMFLLN